MALANLKKGTSDKSRMESFLGSAKQYLDTIKLYHWNVTGEGSYSQHIAIDQAIEQAEDPIDRLAETAIAKYGTLNIVIGSSETPSDIINVCEEFRTLCNGMYPYLPENFQGSIMDDLTESVVQLLFRLKRLS